MKRRSLASHTSNQHSSQIRAKQILMATFLAVVSFAINTRAAIPESPAADASSATIPSLALQPLQIQVDMSRALRGKWMKLEQIKDVKTVGIDGTIYKGICSEDEVSQAFSFNSQQIGNAIMSPILTSHPHLCTRLDFNSVMYMPAEGVSPENLNGSLQEIVLAQVEGHPAMKDVDGGVSTMHIVHGVRLKANCEMRTRPKMMGMMTDNLLDCRIAERGTGTLTFLVD